MAREPKTPQGKIGQVVEIMKKARTAGDNLREGGWMQKAQRYYVRALVACDSVTSSMLEETKGYRAAELAHELILVVDHMKNPEAFVEQLGPIIQHVKPHMPGDSIVCIRLNTLQKKLKA